MQPPQRPEGEGAGRRHRAGCPWGPRGVDLLLDPSARPSVTGTLPGPGERSALRPWVLGQLLHESVTCWVSDVVCVAKPSPDDPETDPDVACGIRSAAVSGSTLGPRVWHVQGARSQGH